MGGAVDGGDSAGNTDEATVCSRVSVGRIRRRTAMAVHVCDHLHVDSDDPVELFLFGLVQFLDQCANYRNLLPIIFRTGVLRCRWNDFVYQRASLNAVENMHARASGDDRGMDGLWLDRIRV